MRRRNLFFFLLYYILLYYTFLFTTHTFSDIKPRHIHRTPSAFLSCLFPFLLSSPFLVWFPVRPPPHRLPPHPTQDKEQEPRNATQRSFRHRGGEYSTAGTTTGRRGADLTHEKIASNANAMQCMVCICMGKKQSELRNK